MLHLPELNSELQTQDMPRGIKEFFQIQPLLSCIVIAAYRAMLDFQCPTGIYRL